MNNPFTQLYTKLINIVGISTLVVMCIPAPHPIFTALFGIFGTFIVSVLLYLKIKAEQGNGGGKG